MITTWENLASTYQESLRERAESLAYLFTRDLEAVESTPPLLALQDGAELRFWIQNNGRVLRARHSGATGPTAALLDIFCQVAEGRPLLEIVEHGVMRTERLARFRHAKAPVPGLVTTKNAGPAFVWLESFVQARFRPLLNSGERNRWDDPVGPQWSLASNEERLALVNEEIPDLALMIGWQDSLPKAVQVEHDSRVVLSYESTRTKAAQSGSALMALERLLKETVEARLELVLESLEDRNRREERSRMRARNADLENTPAIGAP